MEILNKYGKYTAVNLLVNWNIDKFNNVFKREAHISIS